MEGWKITYSDYKPGEEKLREALCTLGNGYFATRGAMDGSIDPTIHYSGTYLAGGYNRLESEIEGHIIENEDLVRWPVWTILKFKPEGGDWFDIDKVNILDFQQDLDLEEGILERKILFSDAMENKTLLTSRRIVSMNNMHVAAIEWEVVPQNWSGKITIHSGLDGGVVNSGVSRYQDLNNQHLQLMDKGNFEEDSVFLKVVSSQSEIVMAQAVRTSVYFDLYDSYVDRRTVQEEKYVAQELDVSVEAKKKLRIEKILALFTSKDKAISDPLSEAKKTVKRVRDFAEIRKFHRESWSDLWAQADIELKADDGNDQLLLRLHIFHLFQTFTLNTIDLDSGIPARGWHGEAYRGHIFWDELYIFPFYNISIPELTRALLMYRYRRLPEARYAAEKEGCKGAMFPWQSGSNGREESQEIHLNPESGNWLPDNTYLQRHVNSAITYNIWQYFQATGDLQFLSFYGAELMLEIAKFWASKVIYNSERKKYEIHGVVGPDEYHTSYPDSEEQGLKNNAYTNFMAVWSLVHAMETIKKLNTRRANDLLELLNVKEEDLQRWDNISRNMFIPFVQQGKIIEQFEGFERLQDLDWKKYRKNHGETLRLDRILEKEGDNVEKYKAVKQPDVLMLFYLFSAEELKVIFDRLGYPFDAGQHIPDNIAYYQSITSHGSTLSKVVHSWVLARSHRERSWHDFKKALVSDFRDIQGGTTAEGIHLGAMAGTVDLIHRCYTGMEFRKECLYFNPQLPQNVRQIRFRCRYRKHWLEVRLTHDNLCLKSHGGWQDVIRINVNEDEFKMIKGEERIITYRKS